MTAAILLDSPKYPVNVGNTLRAAALLGVDHLFWTGTRVPDPDTWPEGVRLPREERMRCYRRTTMKWLQGFRTVTMASEWCIGNCPERVRLTPVCIEIVDGAEDLRTFDHPEHALYVFGAEDNSVSQGLRRACHRFVRIPNAIPEDNPDGRTPYNLSAAVNIVLYDRLMKVNAPHWQAAEQWVRRSGGQLSWAGSKA